MKTLLKWLFPLCALVTPLRAPAEPPFLPFATCSNGKCVISEKDLNELKAFHLSLMRAAESIQEQNDRLENALDSARNTIARNAYCQANRS